MPRLTLEESRRLTGPNLVSDGPGAILDVTVDGTPVGDVVNAWKGQARAILDAVGWRDERVFVRPFEGGASLVISAPIDALYAATEVNEWAWEAAAAEVTSAGSPDTITAAERLRAAIDQERNPRLLALRDEAATRGVMFLSDDDEASVGMGTGSRTWRISDLPDPSDVPWFEIHDVPVALVTGSNGKTTTVRVLAAMVRATDRTPGFCSTDGVFVGGALVEDGDYSGPGGARTVLRDRKVEAAILETARGGILRRGLGVTRADAAIVTNIAIDHLGEYGVANLEAIADAKLVVGKAVTHGGALVLNADDEVLARRRAPAGANVVWISQQADAPLIDAHVKAAGEAVVVEDETFVRKREACSSSIASVAAIPLTLGGAARYNVANILGALALAPHLGIADDAAGAALADFDPTPDNMPGRTNVFDLNGVRVVVDFAHNPHGMAALVETALRMPSRRRLLIIGQAGDRDDESIRAIVQSASQLKPQHIIIKEMEKYRRGREPGEVAHIIETELSRLETTAKVTHAPNEIAAAREALAWAQPRDLLVFPIHEDRDAILELLEELRHRGWKPGVPV